MSSKMRRILMLMATSMFLVLGGVTASLATPVPAQMIYGCVEQGSNKISYSATPQCAGNATLITIPTNANTPILVCVQAQSVRLVNSQAQCTTSYGGTVISLPSNTAPVYFCADNRKGDLRHVTNLNQCTSREQPVVVPRANQPPTDIALSNSTVAENQPSGTTVGTFSTTDPDAGDTHTYSLVSGGADNASFAIAGNQLKTAGSFDFETKSSYSIRVRSTDAGGLYTEEQFTVTVANANDAPADIGLSSQTVLEDQPAGTVVGNFSTVDEDAGDTHSYALVAGSGDGDNASFTIAGNQLKTAATFDMETKSSYSIRVRSSDAGGLSVEEQFTITVTNVNETPSDIALSPDSVAENQAAGTTVGTFSTTDPEAGDTHTYSLVSGGADNASFAIAGNQLQTAAAFDFETKSSYSIRVRSTDAGGLFTEKQFTISVTNANEAPTDIALSNNSVEENQPAGTLVGTFSSVDPDGSDSHGYSLVSGTGDADNASFQVDGVELKTNAVFNYATKSSYSIRVRSTDAGGLSVEEPFTINVNQPNQPPVNTVPGAQTVAEDTNLVFSAANGNAISVSDPDAGGNPIKVSLSVLSGTLTLPTTAGLTFVDGTGNGQDEVNFTGSIGAINTALNGLQYKGNLNYNSSQGAETLAVAANDQGHSGTGGPKFDADSVLITVGAVNDAPVAQDKSFDVHTNMKIALGGLLDGATDPDSVDPGYSPSFSLVSVQGVNCAGCTISNVDTAAGTFDFDPPAGGTGSYLLEYQVRDSGNPAPGAASNLASIAVEVGGPVIWFVNPGAATNGDGRLSSPFNSLSAAAAVDAANHRVFVYSGSTTGGISLNSGEWLIGQGVSGTSFDAVLGVTPPAGTMARPSVGGTKPVIGGLVGVASGSAVRGLNIQPGAGSAGITGSGVNGLAVSEVGVTTVDTTAVSLANLTGSASIANSSIQAGAGDGLRVENSSGTLDRITLDTVTVAANGANANNAVTLRANSTATLKATVTNSTISGYRGNGLSVTGGDTSVMDFVLSGSAVRNGNASSVGGSSNLQVAVGGGSLSSPHNASLTYSITNNTFRDAKGPALSFAKGGVGTGSMSGTISGNTVGVSGVADSGSAQGSGIAATLVGGGSHNVTITNNSVFQFTNFGILVQGGGTNNGGGQGYVTAVVKGNTVSQPSAAAASSGFPTNGIRVTAGTNSGDNTKFCLTIGGSAGADKNTLTGTGSNGGADLRLASSFQTVVAVTGYSGANNANATMQSYLLSLNTAATATVSNNTGAGGPGFSGTCP